MPLEFSGSAKLLDETAIAEAARKLNCEVSAVRAVIDVESRGGFLPDGRPKILFERHYFSRLTNKRFDSSHSDISHRTWGGYGPGGAHQYRRLEAAINLDRAAALRSASWGMFQIMGDNFRLVGFPSVEEFVKAMVSGEPAHLDAFVAFVKKNSLADELARHDWAGFARGYNGPGYRANRYDEKLAAAYQFHNRGSPRTDSPRPTLRIGDSGEAVRELQALLQVTVDGDFGPFTKTAVIKFQKNTHLYADGIVGRNTWAALTA